MRGGGRIGTVTGIHNVSDHLKGRGKGAPSGEGNGSDMRGKGITRPQTSRNPYNRSRNRAKSFVDQLLGIVSS